MRRSEIVEQIKKTVASIAPTAKTILFGSEARGEARSDSDIDLLILIDGDKITLEQEEAITLPLYELELKTGVIISPIVMLKKIWENRPFKTPFYINVINEGIVL
ncbi:nucleotidyltransferase domain-containing protein [Parabacteroides faecis]|uniref:nucleotidyltransferase family protein n=2 Tax=Parabacteroides TaxID=375288 RepID=UPI000EFE8528|nr:MULTISPECIES: nucleotidyltransferase domain-containing protein [Parabacteroides]MBC8617216.1 nucleotidyltransferase domain-containing protein [Parabacteroides faecis]RHS01159.1 nucleotidyltransferase domain-containing protein [Parabacteroides sp. AF14-59]